MKEKQKNLVIAILFSLIITAILTTIIFLNTSRLNPPQAFLMADIVEDSGPYVSWWLLGLIAIVCFVVLTIVFYLLIGLLNKRKN